MRVNIFKIWRNQNIPPTNEGFLEILPDSDSSWPTAKCGECIYIPKRTMGLFFQKSGDTSSSFEGGYCREKACLVGLQDEACPALVRRPKQGEGGEGGE